MPMIGLHNQAQLSDGLGEAQQAYGDPHCHPFVRHVRLHRTGNVWRAYENQRDVVVTAPFYIPDFKVRAIQVNTVATVTVGQTVLLTGSWVTVDLVNSLEVRAFLETMKFSPLWVTKFYFGNNDGSLTWATDVTLWG